MITVFALSFLVFLQFMVNKQKDRKIELLKSIYILKEDSIQTANLKVLQDSLKAVDFRYSEKIKELEFRNQKIKKQYEKSISNYSTIVIDRPEF